MSYRIVICDVNIREKGHYISYMQYVLDNYTKLSDNSDEFKCLFVFNEAARKLLVGAADNPDVQFLKISANADKSLSERFAIWKAVTNVCNELLADELLFMDLDQYQFPIYLSKSRFTISGIYFRPHHRIASTSRKLFDLVFYAKRKKKYISERLMLANKKMKNIFILNDNEGVDFLNRAHKTNVFRYLPDPVFSYPYEISKVEEKYPYLKDIESKFLVFGSISERKNISNIIKAYSNLGFEGPSTLIIAGTMTSEYFTYLEGLIDHFAEHLGSNRKIILERAFLTNEEMEVFHARSQVSLIIYKDFYGSSGILGRAALHRMFTIGPNVGLLKQLISDYQIGICVDPEDIDSISKSMELALSRIIEPDTSDKYLRFYEDHSPSKFLQLLVGH